MQSFIKTIVSATNADSNASRTTNRGNNNGNSNGSNKQSRHRKQRGPPKKRTKRSYTNDNYCFTHGFDIDDDHTSSSCWNKCPGHNNTATVTDRKGGSEKNLHLR